MTPADEARKWAAARITSVAARHNLTITCEYLPQLKVRGAAAWGCTVHHRSGPEITLAEELLRQPTSQVVDTVNHELAHALTGPGGGHGPEWRRNAARLGAKPVATR